MEFQIKRESAPNPMLTFLHTADWQIGKPFQGIADASKRERLRNYRIDAVKSLAEVARREGAAFILVAGDLFDSSTPDNDTIAAFCGAIGSLEIPVYAIPGNHDHAGAGCVWLQPFFQKIQEKLAPHFRILTSAEPVALPEAVLFPCPLFRKQGTEDPSAWLRSSPADLPTERPWLVLAHGSVQGFSSADDEDRESTDTIEVTRLADGFDYIALGDWHGLKQVAPNAWYPGAIEQDRFPKGDDYCAGQVLKVTISARSAVPTVEPITVGRTRWHRLDFAFTEENGIDQLEAQLEGLLGHRAEEDLLRLHLAGMLSLSDSARLSGIFESLRARLLELRLDDQTLAAPTDEELESLTLRDDPVIAQVAAELQNEIEASSDPEAASLARTALKELFFEIQQLGAAHS